MIALESREHIAGVESESVVSSHPRRTDIATRSSSRGDNS